MADTALIPTIDAPASREGQEVALEMDSLRDVKFLNNQMVQFGIRNCKRVERYLELLDKVMEETEDERITVAGASVAVNALRACVGALKQDVKSVVQTQVNIYGAAAIPKALESEHGRDAIANLEDAIAESDAGTNSQPAPIGKA